MDDWSSGVWDALAVAIIVVVLHLLIRTLNTYVVRPFLVLPILNFAERWGRRAIQSHFVTTRFSWASFKSLLPSLHRTPAPSPQALFQTPLPSLHHTPAPSPQALFQIPFPSLLPTPAPSPQALFQTPLSSLHPTPAPSPQALFQIPLPSLLPTPDPSPQALFQTPLSSLYLTQRFLTASEPNLAHGETCSQPRCTRPRYVDPANGRVHDFCGRRHANKAHSSATGITVNSCNLTLISTGSQEFVQVQALFQRMWAHAKGACPAITCVFLITNLQLKARWERYKTQLPVQTVEQYYHGTKLTCDIVNQRTACTDSNCGVCGISRMGMDRQCMRQNIKFQRFGRGFYFAPTSSKCHDYTQGVHIHRAMLQCDILPGKKHTLTLGDKKLTSPPPGFHSVYGRAGGVLNYDELVVYNPDCVMPCYIIVYERDGVCKIAK